MIWICLDILYKLTLTSTPISCSAPKCSIALPYPPLQSVTQGRAEGNQALKCPRVEEFRGLQCCQRQQISLMGTP
jgi:hypothetical protein